MNKGIYFAAFTALLWGFLPIALKVSLNDLLTPVDVSWFRFSIAFGFLAFYYLIYDRSKFSILKKPPLLGIFAALFLAVNYIGFITGIDYTSPAITQVFIQCGPIILAISGFVIFKERARRLQIIGLTVVVFGFFIFYREQILVLAEDVGGYKKGVAWILLGALAWAGYAILQKTAVQRYNPMQLNLILFGVPFILFLPLVNFSAFSTLTSADWGVLLFLGLNTLGSYISLAYALKYLEANKVSVIITLNPIITFIVMTILGRLQVTWIDPENFSVLTIVGAAVVLSGASLTVFRARTKK